MDPKQEEHRVSVENVTAMGIYLLAILIFLFLGYDTAEVHWDYFQLLDREALEQAPVRSLILLHSQPPLLNALLAGFLKVSSLLSIEYHTLIVSVFYVIGAISSVFFHSIVLQVTRSRALAACAVVLVLADPGYHFFQHLYFYPFLLQSLVISGIFFFLRLLKTCKMRYLHALVISLCLVTNTSSLFHPLWTVSSLALLSVLLLLVKGWDCFPRGKHLWMASAAFIVLLTAWPLKNLWVFGSFTFSSWTGHNLARGTTVESDVLSRYIERGEIPPEVEDKVAQFAKRFGEKQLSLLVNPTKSDGSRNWNHYVFLEADKELTTESVRWRCSHPKEWAKRIIVDYLMWTRATYVHPYEGAVRGADTGSYQGYAHAYREVFFKDCASIAESLLGRRLVFRFTLFGMFTLPCLLLVALVTLTVRFRKEWPRLSIGMSVFLMAGFFLAWVLIVPCVTDGSEGNRMRFTVTPCLILMACLVAQSAWEWGKDFFPVLPKRNEEGTDR